jgi:hypothetical protein
MLELRASIKETGNQDEAFEALSALLEEARLLSATKQAPPAKMIGDWQSTETLYAVVDSNAFADWRIHVQAFLNTYCEDADLLWYGFDELCRFPQFFEFLEGQKFLVALQKSLKDKAFS